MTTSEQEHLPEWLSREESYDPPRDRDSFVGKSTLSIMSVLEHFRLDDGTEQRFSPSASAKLIFGFACILLVSLSTNFFFTLVVLAGVLMRMVFLPAQKLKRVIAVAGAAALMTALVMIPAVLLGQPQSAVRLALKVFVSVSIALIVALSTPFNQLTAALRVFHVPNIFILTIDLALKSIVSLGTTALEVLTSLRLRSVGKNTSKSQSLGNVAGVVFLKAQEASQDTYDAMSCRGFAGEYVLPNERLWRGVDAAWLVLLIVLLVLFLHLEGLIFC